MSDTYLYKGKLVIVAKQPELEATCKNILDVKCPRMDCSFYESYAEALANSDVNGDYMVIQGVLYQVKDYEKRDDYEDFVEIYPNPDGSLNFRAIFYDGGTCLQEMLEEGIVDYENRV